MRNTYISAYMHYIFSTKNRLPLIDPKIQKRLWAYMSGTAKRHNMKAIAIGGVIDHAHILLYLPATITISKAIQLIKGSSSKWIKDNYEHLQNFSWQEGYGAFSVNISLVQDTIKYINRQEQHHKQQSYQDEFIMFLEKNKVKYDKNDIWN
ncbi:Transposase IS200-like protein [Candidatus Magnetomorum sp. HK-1]|nr:Transposase IS200-like protein [Candidatus Magnetomorum sp. HK-1]